VSQARSHSLENEVTQSCAENSYDALRVQRDTDQAQLYKLYELYELQILRLSIRLSKSKDEENDAGLQTINVDRSQHISYSREAELNVEEPCGESFTYYLASPQRLWPLV
jgi:hypothetical protein